MFQIFSLFVGDFKIGLNLSVLPKYMQVYIGFEGCEWNIKMGCVEQCSEF